MYLRLSLIYSFGVAPYRKLQAAQICNLRKKRGEGGLTRKTTGKFDRVGLSRDRSEEFRSRSI